MLAEGAAPHLFTWLFAEADLVAQAAVGHALTTPVGEGLLIVTCDFHFLLFFFPICLLLSYFFNVKNSTLQPATHILFYTLISELKKKKDKENVHI